MLEHQLTFVLENSLFYQKKFREIISRTKLSHKEIFSELPFTTKTELLQDQQENAPFGNNLCVSRNDILRIHKTSGTTQKPLILALTQRDIEHTIRIGAKCFQLSGLKKSDIVIHCLNYNMWAGGYTDHQSLETAGAAVIPFGIGHTKELIETILTIRPTSIHCTPSYLRKIESVLLESFQLTPFDLGLKLGLFGAESGLQNPEFRSSIEKKWGFKAMNANYGMSDVLSMFGAECFCQNGLHFMATDILYTELIDPNLKTNLSIEKGSVGELVLTHIDKQAQPLIRYRTGDIIKIISTEKCQCGESGFKFEIVGRSDDMFVVKGINVFISAFDKIINEHLDVLSGQYQIHINKTEPIDKVLLLVEIKNVAFQKQELIINMLSSKFAERLLIKPDICIKTEGELPLTEGKTKKLFKTLIHE